MITSETVFVLGAGASIPYGFPSGIELREELCKVGTAGLPISDTLMVCGISNNETGLFASAFRDSRIGSIDAFLSRRNEFVDIGKLAIAAVLCARENPRIFDYSNIEDDWYFALWNAMVADVHQADDLVLNKIKIITFNYDRSLEYYLFTAIRNTFGLAEVDTYSILHKISIKHVYGQLGEFPEHPFQVSNSPSIVEAAANGIRIIPEDRENNDVTIREIRAWLSSARNICFLGFGFDSLNIHRLELSSIIAEKFQIGRRDQNIYTSGYGKTSSELSMIRNSIYGGLTNWYPVENEKSLMTLRNNAHLLA